MTASALILEAGITSTWATQFWSADILASNTAAFGLDLFNLGQSAGITRTMSTSITSMVAITCSTHIIPALVSHSAS